jgi:hypothetical protein
LRARRRVQPGHHLCSGRDHGRAHCAAQALGLAPAMRRGRTREVGMLQIRDLSWAWTGRSTPAELKASRRARTYRGRPRLAPPGPGRSTGSTSPWPPLRVSNASEARAVVGKLGAGRRAGDAGMPSRPGRPPRCGAGCRRRRCTSPARGARCNPAGGGAQGLRGPTRWCRPGSVCSGPSGLGGRSLQRHLDGQAVYEVHGGGHHVLQRIDVDAAWGHRSVPGCGRRGPTARTRVWRRSS